MKNQTQSTSLTPIETALQTQFKPDANSVREAFDRVEQKRADFTKDAIAFGLCALAAKAIVGHGKFGKWLSDALAENGTRPMAERTAKDYIGLAKVYVEKLSTPQKLTGVLAEGVDVYCEVNGISREKFELSSVLASTILTHDLLLFTLSDMTLTQLRQLLREGADLAQSEEKQTGGSLPKDLKGGGTNPEQSDFFHLLDQDIFSIDQKIRSRELTRLPKDKVLQYADALIERGQKLRDAVDSPSK